MVVHTMEQSAAMMTPDVNKRGGPPVLADKVRRCVPTAGGSEPILDGICLEVRAGECVAIVGPSGCGKTMFLNMVAGLEWFNTGTLLVRDKPPQAGQHGMGYAFARDALLPWRTAIENVELSLELAGFPKKERRGLAQEALNKVGLGAAAAKYRAQLSQGMRQRVALARTFVTRPTLLMLDEPFAALDAQTRIAMQDLLLELLQEYNGSVLLVTHDLGEAITLADRVMLFSHKPARVVGEYRIDLEKPRVATTLRATPRYHQLYDEIWTDLSREVQAAL